MPKETKLEVRLDQSDYNTLKATAANAGMSLSDYVRGKLGLSVAKEGQP